MMGNSAESKQETKENEDVSRLKILCFGDSLTHGYLNMGRQHIPYSNTLQKLIETDYNCFKLEIIESGVDGEKITFSMVNRITELMKNNTFDIVVVLGGTNDVGTAKKASQIIDALNKIYTLITVKHKAKCIALTIPPYGGVLSKHNDGDFANTRSEVNKFIVQRCADSNNSMVLCDLYEYIDSSSDESKGKFFDKDGLHFSEHGYDMMGQLVYKVMKLLLNELK
eukprot:190572_1